MNSKLKIEVLLAAVDKLTRPLKQAMAGNQALARAVKESRDQLKQFQAAQSSIDAFRKLTKESKDTGQALAGARQRLEAVRQQMEQAGGASIKLSREYAAAERAVDKLSMAHRKRLDAARAASAALQKEGIDTRQLSATETTLAARIQETNRALEARQGKLDAVARRQRLLNEAQQRYSHQLEVRDKIAGGGAATVATGAAIGAPVFKMVGDFSQFENAMLGVARQVDGARDDNGKLTATYYEMGDAIKAMATQIPMATTEIAALVEGGARMGVKGKADLLEFARVAALAATAFDLPADQLSEDMGKIANVYKVPIKNISELGDVINYLDDNAQSKGADIINVMQRIAGNVGSMDYKQAAALGSTFLSLGASAEVAATASKAMVRELQIAAKQPKRFQRGLKELGLNAKQIEAQMAHDTTGAILKVLEAVNKLPKVKQMGVMVDLFGKEYGDDAAKLADNLGEYRKQLALVNDAKAKGSMQREGDASKDTLTAQWQLTKNRLFNQSSEMGKALRQPLMDIMKAAADVLERISAWTKANPALAATLVKIAAAVSVLLAVAGTLGLAIAAVLGPIALARLSLSTLGIRAGGVVEKLVDLRKAGAGAGQSLSGKLSAGVAAAKRAGQGLADVWRASSPREPLKRLWEWTKGLKTNLPAAMRAAGARSVELARAMGTGLVDKFKAGKLAVYKYAGALWRAVGAQLALARASAGSKLGAVTQYVKTRGVKGMAWDGVKGGGRLIGGGIARVAGGAASAIMGIGQALMFVGRLAMANPIGLVIGLAALLIYKYWEPIKAWFSGFWEGLKEGLAPLGAIFDQVFAAIGPALEPLRPVWDWLVGAFKTAWEWVSKLLGPVDASKQSLDAAANSGKGFGKWLANLIVIGAELAAKFITVGLDIMSGIVSGIKKGIVWVKDAILGVGDMLPEWLRKKLDIHSPSRVFATIGGHTMAGLEQGIDKGQAGPLASMREAAKRLTAAGAGVAIATAPAMAGHLDHRPPLRASPPAVAAQPSAVNLTIHAAPGMNEQQLAALVQRKVEQALAQAASRQAAARRSRLGDMD
ncbi:phage tail tape measure protein [Chromobacterium sp. IIBBL 290-4]|uniref:phage tail tape measure protein n=1 Tax=Chromobacterium sp. IIBBL 290-4 TaxID=2953890 RepID=UPI0020B7C31F|nr:phage tail tape measure protein [Chromobacterium sp. IIBBL 290-4]UTH73334.1 phage tail tape measure protein [Chromobacterium sp. IIBBL 290-4]